VDPEELRMLEEWFLYTNNEGRLVATKDYPEGISYKPKINNFKVDGQKKWRIGARRYNEKGNKIGDEETWNKICDTKEEALKYYYWYVRKVEQEEGNVF